MDTPLSPADRMRLRLAKDRLREMRELDLGNAQAASLILTVERLGNALEDLINLVHEACPHSNN